MLVSLMLPVSIIESRAFREFMSVFDPSFNVPTRHTVKTSGLGAMYEKVDYKIRALLNSMSHINISVDGWSDAVIRCFNGYIAQGIDNDWHMHTIYIAFQHVKGKHTGQAIKKQFEDVALDYKISNKVFKIVADQAANVKKAFVDTEEAEDPVIIAATLVQRQKKLDLLKEKEAIEKEKEAQNRAILEKEIEEMNTNGVVLDNNKNSRKRTAEELLADYDEELEDTEELDESLIDIDDTILDADEEEEDESFDDSCLRRLAYEPCSAHNIQLVLKDGFEEVTFLNELIKKISKNIVSRSKFSALIAEELREFNKKFAKRVVTRWNSILMMARSVLSVTPDQFKKIREKMPTYSQKQKDAKKSFELSLKEREILKELVQILEWFENVTDEFQSNRVSISRVYPCVTFLRNKLSTSSYTYTTRFCEALLTSLEKRFGNLIKNEVYVVSTFLDPNFGLDAFPPEEKDLVKSKMHALLLGASVITENNESTSKPLGKTATMRNSMYIFFKDKTPIESEVGDKISASLDKYIKVVQDWEDTDALNFWRTHEIVFPELALLAKKYLSVQASSAACERMFSIAGHIFSVKRRRLGIRFFTQLLLLKLNEIFM